MELKPMNLPTLLKKPLIAGVIAAATIAVPAVMLPDFSSMVQSYGPSVVNIAVTTKVSTSYQGDDDGDDNGDDGNGGGNGGGNGNSPFGPNSPFAPFFRGLPFQFQNPQQQPLHGEGS